MFPVIFLAIPVAIRSFTIAITPEEKHIELIVVICVIIAFVVLLFAGYFCCESIKKRRGRNRDKENQNKGNVNHNQAVYCRCRRTKKRRGRNGDEENQNKGNVNHNQAIQIAPHIKY
ncbi:uncharacterized protein LOC115884052 isoform X1 [Sitophilus oryzae]|uniref:Uncharacterized protein LOC115884052 isoform X1 n=1 Tax=Sitophilus oryzae TaxID=7048 RepID=A0A6J2Y3U5_SITOR|nr:uncharacterized protein LOC115884052 isoform X1 [Sitophilus oryzae]